jgi:hypothetical protein
MNTTFLPDPIRLACDIANPFEALIDLSNETAPFFVRGDDIQFDIGIFENGSLMNGLLASGPGAIASVTLQLFLVQNDANPAQMAQSTSAINIGLTTSQWNQGSQASSGGSSNAHCSFVFPNAQTVINLNGGTSLGLWLRIYATTADTPSKRITIAEGNMTVKDGPINLGSVISPTVGWRLSTVNGVVVPQWYDPVGALWHTVQILNTMGTFTLQVSDQGYPS